MVMRFDQDLYNRFLVNNSVIGFYDEPVLLRSGGLTFWYANFRALLADYQAVQKAAEFVDDFIADHMLDPTNFFAVPEGPREFASSLNRLLDARGRKVSATSLRSGYKTHGSAMDRYSVGPLDSYMRPVLIEDVSTTGNASTEYLILLQTLGIQPLAVVSMLNRQERRRQPDGRTVEEFLQENYRARYLAMADASSVLPVAVEILKPSPTILGGLREEFADRERYSVEINL